MGSRVVSLWSGRAAVDASDGPWPRVASDEPSGEFRVSDRRVFQAGRKAFCLQWLGAAVRRPEVRRACVDLATATAMIEFQPGAASTAVMAATFSAAVREALTARAGGATNRADWVALTAFPGPDSLVWEVSSRSANQLRLRHFGLGADRNRRTRWLERMVGETGVSGCRASWFSETLTVAFDPTMTNEARILDSAQRAWLESGRPDSATKPGSTEASIPASRRGRYANLAMAGGAFALTLVGLVVPGIPTVPFLLATSYYLARSSPRLDAILLNSIFFGPILREWESHQGLSPWSKGKLIGLTASIVAVTVVVTPIGPVILILILLISLVSVYTIIRLPGVPAQEGEGLHKLSDPPLALGYS